METLSIVIQPSNASPSNHESMPELEPWKGSDNQEAALVEEYENSESRKLTHGKESDDGDDCVTPVSVETEVLDSTWMTSIEEKLLVQPKRIKVSSSNISASIHKVPNFLFQQDKNAFIPHVVSIGPLYYHKRGDELLAIEEHKWRYLNEIVSRKGKAWLKQCMVAVKELEEEARECYSQVIELDNNSFVEMMVLDGCFIVELFRKDWFKQFEDDPIFEYDWLNSELTIDLLMLENQLPFFILQKLLDLMDISRFSLKEAALEFFNGWPFCNNLLPKMERTDSSNLCIHHLLDLLHKTLVLSIKKYPPKAASDSIQRASNLQDSEIKPSGSVQCASKLQESGIKFKRRDDINGAGNLLDIKFDKEKGIIEIPGIVVEERTNPILRNLIACEQCHIYCDRYITTYICFMDCLINSRMDVEILVQAGIIKCQVGSDEDVAFLFNNMAKEVLYFEESFYLFGVCKEINHYCGTTWPKLRATLMHDYFKNPWAVISFIAAVFLLLLTFTQAFFSSFPKFAFGN